jgi:alpha-glucoside transport system permease protein
MSSTTQAPPPPPTAPVEAPPPAAGPAAGGANWPRALLGLALLVLTAVGAWNLFLAMGYYPDRFGGKWGVAILALFTGVGGAALMFWFLNMFIEGLPERWTERLMPYAYLLPAYGFIGLMLIYPTIQTINFSFANNTSTEYVGLQNYRDIFGDDEFWISITNNLLWIIVVPTLTVIIGLVVAVLADKLSASGERVSKSLMFIPMAISFVGASTIWFLVYQYKTGETQNGLLNAVWSALGGDPQDWLALSTGRLNSLLLMVVLIWLQVGFAMILLSSAIKGVPEETIEAARIDGATELQIFFQVVAPQVKGTVITVFVTVLILVLKVFDIVYVLTQGQDKTNVIANLFFLELFRRGEDGRASAIVVILLLAVLPVLIYQVVQFRRQEAAR